MAIDEAAPARVASARPQVERTPPASRRPAPADPPAPPSQREVWDTIAGSFDRTRQRPWAHVEAFLRGLPRGARVLDLMAGNGRHSVLAKDVGLDVVWLDWSQNLATLSAAKAPQVPHVIGDAVHLPFADAAFDAAIAVAAVHGLPAPAQRAASLAELRRVLKPGAPAQVTVWSRGAPRFAALPASQHDVVIPWKADGFDEARTYHLYTAATLQAALESVGLQVESVAEAAIAAPTADNLVALARA